MNILSTERLLLRTVGIDDAAFYLALLNDPDWLRNIGDRGVHTLEQAREAITNGPVAMQALRGFSLYLVERLEDGAAVGVCGLIKRDALDDVDLGYAFLPAFRGLGYAHEAAQAACRHAREDIGLKRIVAVTKPHNEASIRLLGMLGFGFERMIQMSPDAPESNLFGLAL